MKNRIEGDKTVGFRIYRLDVENGDAVEQISPPFHTRCGAWKWGREHAIEVTLDEFDHEFRRSPGGLPGMKYCPHCGVTQLRKR